MSDIASVLTALKDEFDGEIVFQDVLPTTFQAPSVVVVPGDPFITPDTHGGVRENWNILAVVSAKDKGTAFAKVRELSLRIRQAASEAGALWSQASGLRVPQATEQKGVVFAINNVSVKYQPPNFKDEES